MWIEALDRWLVFSSVFGAIVLLLGSTALWFVKQPVHRIRIIQCTLVACFLVPALQQLELLPSYSIGLWQEANEPLPIQSPSTAPLRASVGSEVGGFGSMSIRADNTKQTNGIDAGQGTNVLASYKTDSELEVNTVNNIAATMSWSSLKSQWLLPIIRIAYILGLGLSAVWFLLGWLARRRILVSSVPADTTLRKALKSIAGEKSDQTRLLTNDQIFSPIMWGILRPTIVVPAKLAYERTDINLKFALAHEWSHVSRYDFLNFTLANLVNLVCFYQPAFWWLRKQLTLNQDYLADEFAARQGEQVEDYASFLVTLARHRRSIATMGVLCMADRKSALVNRVCTLVQRTNPLLQRVGRRSAFITAGLTFLVITSLSAVRLSAHAKDVPLQESIKEEAMSDDKKLPDPITYKGKVIDHDSGMPIVGAVVEISHQLSNDPKTKGWSEIEVTKHETDKMGEYLFTLPPEQVAETSLYIEVTTKHPEYQQKGPEGYAHSMILKNLEIGDPPFYETIKLSKGEPIVFRVLTPNGKPATNTQITAYSKASSAEPMDWERGAFQETQTDENGVGRVIVAGDGVLWVFPKDYAPVAIRIGKKRGKIDDIVLRDGVKLTGQVLNTRGEPVANVAVNVEREGDGEEADDFLNNNAVSSQISSGSVTDASGNFTLRPLPPGTYRAAVESRVRDSAVKRVRHSEELKVDDVFLPLQINIEPNTPPAPIEMRAVPHVIVRGRFFDSKGSPRSGHEQNLVAQHNGQFFVVQSRNAGSDGWFEFKVPHGLENAQIDLITNEHSALRWRMKPSDPLRTGRQIKFETLNADVTTIEVVRYVAPILLVKAVDENGNVLTNFKPELNYINLPEGAMMVQFFDGGNVGFEKQSDHRRRSSQLQPDQEFKLSIVVDGFETEPQTLSIPEGETRELTFVMKKK